MKFDLHSHTIHSSKTKWPFESVIKPVDLVETAIKSGLNGIAVTDHETLDGALECLKIVKQKKLDLVIVPGIEISSKDGHILGLGIEEWIKNKKISAEETIDTIRDMGGIAIAAHPFVSNSLRKGIGRQIDRLDFDGIEALNYRTSKKTNKRALQVAKRLDVGITAGSDAHKLSDIGKVWTFSADEDIIQSILKRKTKVFGEEMSRFQLYFYHLNKLLEVSKISSA